MALCYVIKARARREIESAADRWALHRPAAPGAVRFDLESALFILAQRGLGRRVETGRPPEVRRYLMSRTQHWLYFRVRGDVLEALCVWATTRASSPKL